MNYITLILLYLILYNIDYDIFSYYLFSNLVLIYIYFRTVIQKIKNMIP